MRKYLPMAFSYSYCDRSRSQGIIIYFGKNHYIIFRKFITFAFLIYGRLAEWLGIGLQNRVRRFDSATDLNKIPLESGGIFVFETTPVSRLELKKQKSLMSRRLRDFVDGSPITDHDPDRKVGRVPRHRPQRVSDNQGLSFLLMI